MNTQEVLRYRLHAQRLVGNHDRTLEDVVGWLGAVQAQDFVGAKWAVAQRTSGVLDETLDMALAQGSIIRTHVLRPTWHLVMPADIRWMLQLSVPHITTLCRPYYRKYDLDDVFFSHSNAVLAQALSGGRRCTRAELAVALECAGIEPGDTVRMAYILQKAELDAVICSGGLRGKQHTYGLFDERVPVVPEISREEALGLLAYRYFRSHGPATLRDYAWWSGLPVVEAKQGLEVVKSNLVAEMLDGEMYWFDSVAAPKQQLPSPVLLLPNYDEYVVSYKDRTTLFDQQHNKKLDSRGNPLFNNVIIRDGKIVGVWKRLVRAREVVVIANVFVSFTPEELRALEFTVSQYGAYMQTPATLRIETK